MQLLSDLKDITVLQNTFRGQLPAASAAMFDGTAQIRTVIANNVFGPSWYGMIGSGYGEGTTAFAYYLPGGNVSGNAMVGRPAYSYPAGNLFPATIATTDFVSEASGDYTLRSTLSWSVHANALVGVNGRAILNATRSTVTP